MTFMRLIPLMIALCTANAASAEIELSFYGGIQTAPPSDVKISGDDVIPSSSFNVDWEGKSFDAPPYYGIRVTKWQSPSFGYGLDFSHNKVYPQEGELPDGYSRLEFTDGLNTLTANAYYRWQDVVGDITPYVGGGIGLAIPHVEVITEDSSTLGYQVTGPAATIIAGASMPINDRWSVFGEYKGTYSVNDGDLDTGGTVSSDIFTNALNVGVSFNF
ncbi:lipid A oxidase [Loktanella ponticola]|uniref:Lipid A oxidase n=1 Tax=Yoonia ponticola TaxID=1524255 RepID=A0A7W9EWF3_9RHOB|nr:outer membrane beta-barrel protein [Yoonia ponticola]MBB5720549.1 lipid A oxidase [Yoonia ponticola]